MIVVTDVDEFDVGAVTDSNPAVNTVAEDAPVDTEVGITALATDADVTDTVSYSLTEDAGGLFDIHGTTGEVTVAGGLHAELPTSHTIEVKATSTDGSPWPRPRCRNFKRQPWSTSQIRAWNSPNALATTRCVRLIGASL